MLWQESTAIEWCKRTTWNITKCWYCLQQTTSSFCWFSLFYTAPCISAQPLLCWLHAIVQGTEYCLHSYGLGFDNVGELGLAALSWYCVATVTDVKRCSQHISTRYSVHYTLNLDMSLHSFRKQVIMSLIWIDNVESTPGPGLLSTSSCNLSYSISCTCTHAHMLTCF